MSGDGGHEPLVEAIRLSFGARTTRQSYVKLETGKVIAVSRQKMDNGNVVIVFEDVTEQTRANERIRQLAWADELTGLMNRASFKEVLKKTLDVMDPGSAVALHLIDLDHFKSVNDTLGHPTGDLLLVEVAKRISSTCGEEGVVARLGGDEFVIIQRLLPDATGAEGLAKSVMASLCQTFEIGMHRINIGASFGVAVAPQHGRSVDVLLKRADMALYKAKAQGRNGIQYFEENLDVQAQQRRALELDIRTAIEKGEFSLAFQPIVAMPGREIAGFETLIRWQHPARGYVSPAEFIPIAEETGLILEIGRWVLETACREAAGWGTNATVAVNFSAVQFQDPTFPLFLLGTLKRYGLPSSRLELEITETALLQDGDQTIEMLQRVPRHGHPHLARRFRHRLFIAQPAQDVPVQQDQDRRLVRARPRARPERGGGDPCRHQHRQNPRHDGGCRVRRKRGAAQLPPRLRVRADPGLPHRPAGERRRHPRAVVPGAADGRISTPRLRLRRRQRRPSGLPRPAGATGRRPAGA